MSANKIIQKTTIFPSGLYGTTQICGNKSATARGVIFGALGDGTTTLYNPLNNTDSFSIIGMAEQIGAKIDCSNPEKWLITGTGGNLQVPKKPLDAENSGTGFYFFTAIASLIPSNVILTGDEQTQNRPVQTMLDAINALGGNAFSHNKNGLPPITVTGAIKGGNCQIEGTSSQWTSAFLIACPLAKTNTHIHVCNLREIPYINMTLSMLRLAGITRIKHKNYTDFFITANQTYKSFNYTIPADWGSAAVILIAAVITKKSCVTLLGLDFNNVAQEKTLVELLQKMGASISVTKTEDALCSVTVNGTLTLNGTQIDCSGMPDAVPILAVLGCFANGKTVLQNIGSCRIKETDRAKTIRAELQKMGALIEETSETLTVYHSDLHGAELNGHNDHRIVMALAVASLAANGKSTITSNDCTAVSFPHFFETLQKLGATIMQE